MTYSIESRSMTTTNLVCFKAGALPSPPDENDIVFEDIWPDSSTFLCAGFDWNKLLVEAEYLRHTLWPCNQGNRPTCAAFTGATLVQGDVMLSLEFIYYHCETKDSDDKERGMTRRDVLNILKKYGCPPESSYNYGTKAAPSKKVYRKAHRNTIENYYRIKTIDGVKQALINVGPVYVGLPLDPDYIKSGDPSNQCFWGDVTTCENRFSKCSVTGHAVAIVGFNSDSFIFMNSWSTEWGENGYGRLPFEDFERAYEYWCVIPHKKRKPRHCIII